MKGSPSESHNLNAAPSFSQLAFPGDSSNGAINKPSSSAENSRSQLSNKEGGGIVRDGREIETLCVQNSLISSLVSVLSTPGDFLDFDMGGSAGTANQNQLALGSGIGRPMTPKAVNVAR